MLGTCTSLLQVANAVLLPPSACSRATRASAPPEEPEPDFVKPSAVPGVVLPHQPPEQMPGRQGEEGPRKAWTPPEPDPPAKAWPAAAGLPPPGPRQASREAAVDRTAIEPVTSLTGGGAALEPSAQEHRPLPDLSHAASTSSRPGSTPAGPGGLDEKRYVSYLINGEEVTVPSPRPGQSRPRAARKSSLMAHEQAALESAGHSTQVKPEHEADQVKFDGLIAARAGPVDVLGVGPRPTRGVGKAPLGSLAAATDEDGDPLSPLSPVAKGGEEVLNGSLPGALELTIDPSSASSQLRIADVVA